MKLSAIFLILFAFAPVQVMGYMIDYSGTMEMDRNPGATRIRARHRFDTLRG